MPLVPLAAQSAVCLRLEASILNILEALCVQGSRPTCHQNFGAGLGITEKVGADALLGRILCVLLRVPEGRAPHTQAGCLAIKVVAVAS